MKSRCVLLSLLITLLLSVDAHSTEKQRVFRSEANGYSVAIPEGWEQVPENLVGEMLKVAPSEEAVAVRDCEAALILNRDDGQIELPCLIIKVTKYSDHGAEGSLAQNVIDVLWKSLMGLDTENLAGEARKDMSDETRTAGSSIAVNGTSFDEGSMAYRFNMQGETATGGESRGLAVAYIGRHAIVQLMFYCLESDWSRFEGHRNLLFDSFLFDEGMRYEDAPRKLGGETATHVAHALAAVVFGLVFVFPRLISHRKTSNDLIWRPRLR